MKGKHGGLSDFCGRWQGATGSSIRMESEGGRGVGDGTCAAQLRAVFLPVRDEGRERERTWGHLSM